MAAYLGPKGKSDGGGAEAGGGGGGGDDGNDHKNTPGPAPNFNTMTMKKKKKKDGAAATPSLKDCANCGAPEGKVYGVTVHRPCSKCGITYYCSVICQKHHCCLLYTSPSPRDS